MLSIFDLVRISRFREEQASNTAPVSWSGIGVGFHHFFAQYNQHEERAVLGAVISLRPLQILWSEGYSSEYNVYLPAEIHFAYPDDIVQAVVNGLSQFPDLLVHYTKLLQENGKIQAIKALRDDTRIGLKEAKAIMDILELRDRMLKAENRKNQNIADAEALYAETIGTILLDGDRIVETFPAMAKLRSDLS